MINKTLVQQRFKKNLKTYKENCIIQEKMAEKLVNLIDYQPQNILEIGCGTGTLTKKIIDKYNPENYDAIDIVKECETYIKEISEKISFTQADIENAKFSNKYDLIISNAMFQWVENLPSLIKKLKSLLTTNGKIIFTTFGENNLIEIKNTTGIGLNYLTKNEIIESIHPQFIEENIEKLEFDNPIDILRHLKLTGVNSLSNSRWTKSDLKNFEQKYAKQCANKLTYHPIYVIV